MKLKSLDLRRSSTGIDQIDQIVQADAIIKLYKYKNTVNVAQAEEILNKILVSNNVNLKYLLLVINDKKEICNSLNFPEKEMKVIRSKLVKVKIVN